MAPEPHRYSVSFAILSPRFWMPLFCWKLVLCFIRMKQSIDSFCKKKAAFNRKKLLEAFSLPDIIRTWPNSINIIYTFTHRSPLTHLHPRRPKRYKMIVKHCMSYIYIYILFASRLSTSLELEFERPAPPPNPTSHNQISMNWLGLY